MSWKSKASKSTAFGALALGVALAVSSCTSSGGDSSGSDEAKGDVVLGYSNPYDADPGLKSIAYGAEQAVELLGVDWTVTNTDANLSGDKQVSDIDTMVTQKVDSIGVWVLNSGAAEPPLQRASEAGIPVFGLNTESPSIVTNVQTSTDSECDVYDEQAAFIAERIPNANVLILGGPEVPTINFFTECFVTAAGNEGLTIVDDGFDTTSTEAGSQEIGEVLITANQGNFDAIWVYSDPAGTGVAAVLEERNIEVWTEEKPSGVIVLSRDGTSAGAENVRSGRITATWDSNFAQLGAAWAQLVHQHLVEGVALEDLPKEFVIPATKYDITNIDDYNPQMDRPVTLPLG